MTDLAEPSTEIAVAEPVGLDQLAIRERMLTIIEREANVLANAPGFVPRRYAGKPNEIIAAGLYGASFGWDVPTSLRNIDVIEGKPSLATQAEVALVHRAGHLIQRVEVTTTSATAYGKRADTGAEGTVTFTIQDAQVAGLANKRNWKTHPKSMLWARAASQLCRELFSDVTLGAYSEEEISDAEGIMSTPAVSDQHALEPVEPVATLRAVLEVFDELEPARQDKINARCASRYRKQLGDVPTLYSIPEGQLPPDEVGRLLGYVEGQYAEQQVQQQGNDHFGDGVEDAVVVTEAVTQEPTNYLPDEEPF